MIKNVHCSPFCISWIFLKNTGTYKKCRIWITEFQDTVQCFQIRKLKNKNYVLLTSKNCMNKYPLSIYFAFFKYRYREKCSASADYFWHAESLNFNLILWIQIKFISSPYSHLKKQLFSSFFSLKMKSRSNYFLSGSATKRQHFGYFALQIKAYLL